ncbi:hypothetical protein PM3016_1484 [Paenibacillus mucilaginosus 3016]|uniref:Uncharacterized protein n=1 Tax=Paenibacillus mucilaginosus 3016 TaxID=1116391 RepID=H6NGW7_9BACL|nr:hypothetical protein PM3016_1484 [Paenibacillus mucilaginosus 3016]
MEEAENYVLGRLEDIGLTLTSQEVRAAIEKAVLEHNAVVKNDTKRPAEMRGDFLLYKPSRLSHYALSELTLPVSVNH